LESFLKKQQINPFLEKTTAEMKQMLQAQQQGKLEAYFSY
jgi:hypothetical protein